MLQLFYRLTVQRIQHLRPIEGDVGNPVSFLLTAAYSASPRYLFFCVLGTLPAPRAKGRLCLIFFSRLTTNNQLLSEFHRPRILRVRVIVKSPSRLPPVPSRTPHPLQQRRRADPPSLHLTNQ